MPEYLLEIRSDEVPWRLLHDAARRLGTRLFEDLMSRGLGPLEVITGVTPRRFVFCHRGLPAREPDREEVELGPPVAEAYDAEGEPTEALLGFAERLGVEPGVLERTRTERGEYVACRRQAEGRRLAEVLAERVPILLAELRWGMPVPRFTPSDTGNWIRPVRGVLSLLDGEVVPLSYGGVEASRFTIPHVIHAPEPAEVESFEDYLGKLAEHGVEVRYETRRKLLAKRLAERAEELGGRLVPSTELLRRLALQVEIPGLVDGTFTPDDAAGLPDEILLATLAQEPGAFAVEDTESGELRTAFLTAMDRRDDPSGRVRAGQEMAVAGRLADVRFHVAADRRRALAERARGLDELAFHPRLSHYAAKHERIGVLVELIAGELGWEDDLGSAQQAAGLLKADLTTNLVRLDGSLRGRVGGIYAREEGYIEPVWQAIYDQYKPGSLGESIPRGRAGRLVAVADTLDTLIGAFGIGEAPSGSNDPRRLRRRAQALLRILIEGHMPLDLDLIAARAVLSYGDLVERGAADLLGDFQVFLDERLRQLLGQHGFAADEIGAVMAVGSTSNLPDLAARLRALRAVREEPELPGLVLTAKRIFNMVKGLPESELRPDLLVEGAEKDLYADYLAARRAVDETAEAGRYEECLRRMMDLVPSLDRFFAEVLVMDEDAARRDSRVALLQTVRRVFWKVARLKELVVEKEPTSLDDTVVLVPERIEAARAAHAASAGLVSTVAPEVAEAGSSEKKVGSTEAIEPEKAEAEPKAHRRGSTKRKRRKKS